MSIRTLKSIYQFGVAFFFVWAMLRVEVTGQRSDWERAMARVTVSAAIALIWPVPVAAGIYGALAGSDA